MKRVLVIIMLMLLLVPVLASAQEGESAFSEEFRELVASLPKSRGEDGAFVLGDPDAPLTVIEFFDWACSHCQDYLPQLETFLMTTVAEGDANFEARIFPTAGGARTIIAGRAAECADEQREGAFWDAYMLLYDLALAYNYDNLEATVAERLELDAEALVACVETADQPNVDTLYGVEHGVTGTPSILVREGQSDPIFIRIDGRVYDSGAPSAEILAQAATFSYSEMVDPQLAMNASFLDDNAAQDGVVTTASGLQYRVEQEGDSTLTPGPTDEVTVHYEGFLADGTKFDSSRDRGEPVTFPLNAVIAGFAEGLQLMSVGDIYTLWLPPELAYGTRGAGGGVIPPNAVLVFRIELLGINGDPQ